MNDLVPLKLREYVQRLALSLPIGVGVYVLGHGVYEVANGNKTKNINLYITGFEILTEGKHYQIRETDDNSSYDGKKRYLTLYGREFSCLVPYSLSTDQTTTYRQTIDGVDLTLILIEKQGALTAINSKFKLNISRAYVDDVNTVEWTYTTSNENTDGETK